MKKLFFLLIIVYSCFGMYEEVTAELAGDNIVFQDSEFKDRLIASGVDETGDNEISVSEAAKVTDLNLTYNLSNEKITNISGIEYFVDLESLNLSGNNITNISALSGLTNLATLHLSSNKNLSDISALSGLYNLTTLNLSNNENLSSISALSGLTNLTTLNLSNNKSLSDISALRGLTNLATLNLSDNKSLSDISELSEMNSLKNLYISNIGITNINELSRFTNLTALDLGSNDIDNISALSGLVNLVELYLSHNDISNINELSGLTRLNGLDLSSNKISDINELSGLSELKNLTKLDLSDNEISDINGLSGLEKLALLYLSTNNISDINELSGLDNLRFLILSNNIITDISALSELTLTSLHLNDNPINNSSTRWAVHKDTLDFNVGGKNYEVWVVDNNLNNDLSELVVSEGALEPAFNIDTINYDVTVPYEVTKISVTATKDAEQASIAVNGNPVNSGEALENIPLNTGNNTITIVVTAADTSTRTYTISVYREESSNNRLSGLEISTGTLSSPFDPMTTTYQVNVSNDVSSITITPTKEDAAASIRVNENPVNSGEASENIPLTTGNNTITIVVTAANTSTRTYTISVYREESNNNRLSGLEVSMGTLSEPFDPVTTTYQVNVSNEVSSIIITPTKEDATASITVNGNPVNSGEASESIQLNTGNNIIAVVVTAEDTSTRTYTISVYREKSNNNRLSGLEISMGTLSEPFDPMTTTYQVNVNNGVSSITITPTKEEAAASITVNGNPVNSGEASDSIQLNTDYNTITVVVTAEDTSTRTYTILVYREKSNNNRLSGLEISTGTLSEPFDPMTTTYQVNVSNGVSSITITPTKEDAAASITVNGNPVNSGEASESILLNVGDNTIAIVVTAEDSSTRTYTITVRRAVNYPVSSYTPPQKKIDVQVSDENEVTVLSISVSSEENNLSGNVSAEISNAIIETILKKMKEISSNEKSQIIFEIKGKYDTETIEIKIASGALQLIPENSNTEIIFQTPIGTIMFDMSVINAIRSQVNTDSFSIIIQRLAISQLPNSVRESVGVRPVYEFAVLHDGQEIKDFGDGFVQIDLPYELQADENKESIVICYIDSDGQLQPVIGGYDDKSKTVRFITSHFSTYAIMYNKVTFQDVQMNDWYYCPVCYVAAREIANGTSDNCFNPDANIKRGDLLVMLMKAYGLKPLENPQDNFEDAGNTYYSNYLAKAKELGITKGIGNNCYAPEREVTRQEMFVLLYNTLSTINQSPEVKEVGKLSSFLDADKIDLWANEAVGFLVESEIILGSNGNINPKGTATRAEIVQLLYNLLSRYE